MTLRRWAVAASLLVVGCGAGPAQPRTMNIDVLRAVPTQVRQGDATWTLEVEAWRSFQPITTSVGEPMIAVVRLVSSSPVAPEVRVDTVYLARGADLWSAAAREEVPRTPGQGTLEVVVRDGPRWAPGDSIDVVARVVGAGADAVLVRAPRVQIMRVD